MTTQEESAYAVWLAADTAWHDELKRQFGSRAGDIKHSARGHGLPGSRLFKLYTAYRKASDQYCATTLQAAE